MSDQEEAIDTQINKDLYEALMNNDDAKVLDKCASIPKGPLHTVTIHEDTVIHIATYHKKTALVLQLLNMVSATDSHKLTWTNKGGSTILHETATNNKTVDAAREMLRRAPMLLSISNKVGETPLFYAARHGKTKIFKYLHDEVCKSNQGPDLKTFLSRDDKSSILHLAVLSKNYWMAHEIAVRHKHLIHEKDEDNMTPLQLLSSRKLEVCPTNFFKKQIYKLIDPNVEDTSWMLKPLKRLRKQKFACHWARKLITLLVQNDTSWEKTESMFTKQRSKFHQFGKGKSIAQLEELAAQEASKREPETPLILATKSGCTEVVTEILEQYPQAIEHIDQDGRNILHVAILYRNHEVFDFVVDRKYAKQRLRGKIDNDANTLLHMVGEQREDDEIDADLKGPAYVLKENMQMFKKVKDLTTTLDLFKLNSKLKPAEQMFYENNDKLRMEAKNWMTDNAKNYSIVAVLIATVAFTAAYTIPGGVDKNGQPVFKSSPLFMFFTAADAVSLSAALTSVIIFLNVITSTFKFKDFEGSLILKMDAGIMMLMISLAMLMVAFAATLILTISRGKKWTDITLYVVSFFPVIIFTFAFVGIHKIDASKYYAKFKSILWEPMLSSFSNANPKPAVWYSRPPNPSAHPPSAF
ncbi:putative ankyrin repeat-containing domain, PGG domain, ankyrin repeat-containing domain superfamily [Helianthus annuus]|nr:putative ankyrin repeat-containing domain, PGG domain, ankyrin repeat-containing domain superfamily [Helianthus annuus]KAJ0637000.1 putative ankyrin repeat-containing domain, PGG domain, ankyrin repeat-containing domain superfamily [Helianthus annuus]